MSNATIFRSSFKDINRKSISESNLLKNDFNDELPLNDSERAQENLANMKVRKNALEETLEKKLNELRQLCLREGELTGVLPKEFPLKENEELPTIRRRVRTEFTFSDKLLMQPKTKEEEKLTKLELEFEIQCKIVKATSKLCNEMNTKKSIKKQRKQVYQQALAKLKDIEKNLQLTKKTIEEEQSRRMKLKNSIRYIDNEFLLNNNNNNELISDDENNLNKKKFDLFNKDLNCLTMQSAPSTPVRCKLRNKNFLNESNDQLTINPRIDNLIKQRFNNNNSPEYDTISSSSLGSTNNVFLNNYCKLKNTDRKPNEFNNYEELIENSPETQAKKYFGVPTRRSAIAPNFARESQDDSNILIRKQQKQDIFYPLLDKYTNERSLTRHNSLDKFKQQEALKGLNNNNLRTIDTQQLSSTNLLSPNQLQSNQFNFSSFTLSSSNSLNNNQLQMKNIINKSQGSSVNMSQRPLPSPPRTVENKKILTNNQTATNNSSNKPPPLNLNNQSDQCLLNNKINYGSLIKTNPIRSPSTVSMFMQSPLDFEKATNLCLNKQQKFDENEKNLIQNNNNYNNNRLNQRDTIVRATPITLNCTNEQQLNQNQQHSPVPILPPRTPITSKPPSSSSVSNPLNSINNFNNLNLNSYQQMSNFPKNMISSNPNLNYTTATQITTNKVNEKKTKTWTETCIDTFKIPNNKFIQSSNCYYINHTENQLNNHLNAIQFIREKENQLLNSLPPRNTNFNHQFLKEDSRSSLNSNSLSSNSSSILSSNQSSSSNLYSKSSQITQPFVVEETKPYELSDFYKYSQKFKNQQKNLQQQQQKDLNKESTEIHSQQHYHINQISNNNQSDIISPDKQNDSNELMSMTMVEESFMAKNQVASEFSKEMKDWLTEKYAGQNNKAATLV